MPNEPRDRWPLDVRIFGALCALWSLELLVRVATAGRFDAVKLPFQDVLFGVKFYGTAARVTMTIQATVFAAFGIGMFLRRRWAMVLALIYFVQVVAGHLYFIVANFGDASQAVHVKIASIEGPAMVIVLFYLWYRGRSVLRREHA
jgi:hypothetical protein